MLKFRQKVYLYSYSRKEEEEEALLNFLETSRMETQGQSVLLKLL